MERLDLIDKPKIISEPGLTYCADSRTVYCLKECPNRHTENCPNSWKRR